MRSHRRRRTLRRIVSLLSVLVLVGLVVGLVIISTTPNTVVAYLFTRTPSPIPATPVNVTSAPGSTNPTSASLDPTPAPALPTSLPASTATMSYTPWPLATPRPTLAADEWMKLPVIPTVSARTIEIYHQGLALGRNPKSFSKIGDCQNVSSFFLGIFDHSNEYTLGAGNADLQTVIDQFQGSFDRSSLAVRGGLNVAAVLSPIYSDRKFCGKMESSLACEIRLNNPSLAFISMETWWSQAPAQTYEQYMRQVLEYTISQGVVPILATKADNLEGDNSINATIAKLAQEYDIPLWNFWAATQPLPSHGLTEDGFHLTMGHNDFGDPQALRYAWPWRNLTALQSLNAVWRGLGN